MPWLSRASPRPGWRGAHGDRGHRLHARARGETRAPTPLAANTRGHRSVADFILRDHDIGRIYALHLIDHVDVHGERVVITPKDPGGIGVRSWLRTRSRGSPRDGFAWLAPSRKCERLRIQAVGRREPGRSPAVRTVPQATRGGPFVAARLGFRMEARSLGQETKPLHLRQV